MFSIGLPEPFTGIETTGESEVIYQPQSEGLSGSAAQHVTGRADVIQIIDSDNRLYQVSNGETPQLRKFPLALFSSRGLARPTIRTSTS